MNKQELIDALRALLNKDNPSETEEEAIDTVATALLLASKQSDPFEMEPMIF
jgi:hypothetical protein